MNDKNEIHIRDNKVIMHVNNLTNEYKTLFHYPKINEDETKLITIDRVKIDVLNFSHSSFINVEHVLKIEYEEDPYSVELGLDEDQICYVIEGKYLNLYVDSIGSGKDKENKNTSGKNSESDRASDTDSGSDEKGALVLMSNPKVEILRADKDGVVKLDKEEIVTLIDYENHELSRFEFLAQRNRAFKWKDIINKPTKIIYLFISRMLKENDDICGLYSLSNNIENSKDNKPCSKNDSENKIAILVHGLGSKIAKEYDGIQSYLVNKGYHVYGFDYQTIGQKIDNIGAILSEEVNKLINSECKEILIVAHSMGGLVSRSALVNHKANINGIIFAGTPNNGTLLVESPKLVRIIFILASVGFLPIKRNDLLDLILGNLEGLHDLYKKSGFIKDLNGNENSTTLDKYFALAGNMTRVSDVIVNVNNVVSVNKYPIPSIIKGWNHFNYFKQVSFDDSIGRAIKYFT